MLASAERIVSLLPSATEIVCALGLEDRLVGISHSCDYPPNIVHLPRLSRTRVNLDGRSSGEIDAAVR
ncbi:MAG TPA: BtuF-related (seleno)protein, partial [Gemmatimonadales bacterium]|nr:BtuF-related (seleno)protein [Gemmatimonadales bacterium]